MSEYKSVSAASLIEDGYLCDARYFMPAEDSLLDADIGQIVEAYKQLAPELERYDIQGGDGNGVYPDKDKDGEWCKAEDARSVIGSLREAFNIKCRVDAEEQAESVKLQNVLFADYRDCRPADAGLFGWAAAALIAKAQGVVMPERAIKDGGKFSTELKVTGWNACLDEVARLNAASVQQPKCKTCNDNGRIGGPSFYAPDEGGEPCPDCSATVQQVSVPASAFASRAITHYEAALLAAFPSGSSGEVFNQWNEARRVLAAAPAAPAADAGLVDALGYQVLFDAIAAATSVYANGAVNISVQAFRDALAAHSAKGVV